MVRLADLPERVARDAILATFNAAQLNKRVLRRPPLKFRAVGYDWHATMAVFHAWTWESNLLATLQGGMAGGSVTRSVAVRWRGDGREFPHCPIGVTEADLHKWRECPRWAAFGGKPQR